MKFREFRKFRESGKIRTVILPALCVLLAVLLAVLTAGCGKTAPSPGGTDALGTPESATAPDVSSVQNPTESAPIQNPAESGSAKPVQPAKPDPVPELEIPANVSGFGAVATLTLKNLAASTAVQQFVFWEEGGAEYLLVTQRVNDTAYLNRCLIDRDQKTATMVDNVILTGVGHTESMDVSVHNGVPYVFFTSGANPGVSQAWGTTISRVRYENGKISDFKTLMGLQCLAEGGKIVSAGATPYRINFGLDDSADVIAIYGKIGKNGGSDNLEHWLTVFRLSALHGLLDGIEPEGFLNLPDCENLFLATTGKVSSKSICANGSFQGLEVAPDGSIYITGGTTSSAPQLSIFQCSGTKITRSEVRNIDFLVSRVLGTRQFTSGSYIEIESIKSHNGGLYCVFNPAGGREKNYTELYFLSETF